MKLKDLIDRYIREMGTEEQPGIRPLGVSHLYCLRRLQRTPIADKEADALTKHDIIEHVKSRRSTGICAATAMHDITFIRGVLQYAPSGWEDCDNVSAAPIVAALPMLSKHGLVGKSTPRTRRPTDEEIHSLIVYLGAQDEYCKIKAVPCFMFALVSTRRRGEICRLLRDDIDWGRKTYMIRDVKHPTKKKGNHKTFPLFDELAEIIKAQPHTDDPRVFPYNAQSLGARFTLAKKALGIENLRFHDSRREAISRYLQRGLKPHEVRLISGHENTVILERVYDNRDATYLHGRLEQMKSANQVAV